MEFWGFGVLGNDKLTFVSVVPDPTLSSDNTVNSGELVVAFNPSIGTSQDIEVIAKKDTCPFGFSMTITL